MKQKEINELVASIASMCEKAYRRGFQQGIISKATEHQAYKFRFYNGRNFRDKCSGFYRTASPPPGPNLTKFQTSSFDRLVMEIPHTKEFQALISLCMQSRYCKKRMTHDLTKPT